MDRDFAIVPVDPATRQLEYEHTIRTTSGLWQCSCGISKPYLAPVGQQPKQAIMQVMPTSLISSDQAMIYGKPSTSACWWDGYEFTGETIGLPIRYKKVERRLPKPIETIRKTRNIKGKWIHHKFLRRTEHVDGYVLHGIFCSWNCARAYGEVFYPELRNFIGSWIFKILLQINKEAKKKKLLPPDYTIIGAVSAPHFSLLKKYGGRMDINKFRALKELDNNRIFSVIPAWLNVVPAGMLATDIPRELQNFRTRYNVAMDDLNNIVKPKRPMRRYFPIRKTPLDAMLPKKRKRVNHILRSIKQK